MNQVKTRQGVRIGIIAILLVSVLWGLVVVLPLHPQRYDLPPVAQLGTLREMRQEGLVLPATPDAAVLPLDIGGHRWVAQELAVLPDAPALLLIRPQSDLADKPYVDWSDLDGFFQWQRDPQARLTVAFPDGQRVNARWFIARDPGDTQVVPLRQTVAVAQWYAFDRGGQPAPSAWFWRDQHAQLRRDRVPWIAVCIRMPIAPGTALTATRAPLTEMIQVVQGAITVALEPRSRP